MANTRISRNEADPTGNSKTFTLSQWVKRGKISAEQAIVSHRYTNSYYFHVRFNDNDTINIEEYNSGQSLLLTTNRKFRDTNGFYNIVISADTTQATSSNRIKLYINGVQETSFSTANYPSQNANLVIDGGAGYVRNYGDRGDGAMYFDGAMSHIHYTQGTAYDASAFGSTDSTTGEWKINTSPSVTYGSKGYFILKDGNSVTDQSGNSNNFTVGAGTLTKTEDCPSNVFATLNPLVNINSNLTLSKGNNTMTLGSTNWIGTVSSLGISSGKYYWEIKVDTNNFMHGILGETANMTELSTSNSGYIGKFSNGYAFYYQSPTVRKQNNSSGSTYGTAPSSGDILMVAFDATNGTIWVGKNGTWFNSATQSEIENGTTTNSMYSSIPMTETFFPATCGESNHVANYNFGNGYFGTTAVSSAGTNASGNGIFEYDCPSGYTALSTKGLNL